MFGGRSTSQSGVGRDIAPPPRRPEWPAWREGISLFDGQDVGRSGPRQRVERQPKPHRRVARNQVETPLPQEPGPCGPAALGPANPPKRQRVAHHSAQTLAEHAAQAVALHLVGQSRIERVDIRRQRALAPEVVPDILVTGLHVIGRHAQVIGECCDESDGVGGAMAVRVLLVGEEAGISPGGLAIRAPVAAQRPARQLLAGVPLALTEMLEPVGAVPSLQSRQQIDGARALGGPEGRGVPLLGIAIRRRYERRLPAHRQANVPGAERGVHGHAALEDRLPLRIGVRLGHPR